MLGDWLGIDQLVSDEQLHCASRALCILFGVTVLLLFDRLFFLFFPFIFSVLSC